MSIFFIFKIKKLIKRLPIIGKFAKNIKRKFFAEYFPGSGPYWEHRYATGGSSGTGSCNKLAEFKAEVLNGFVLENGIKSVIEYGCGDGNQLRLASYPKYLGFDISNTAVSLCEKMFQSDTTKSFKLIGDYDGEKADLTISLDVIFHLVEDDAFESYMRRLFDSSELFVIIYSSNFEDTSNTWAPHLRHRKFTNWITENASDWKLIHLIHNRYPYIEDEEETSLSEFFIYKKSISMIFIGT